MQYILKSKLAQQCFREKLGFTVMVTPGGFSKPIHIGRGYRRPQLYQANYAIKVTPK